MANYTVRYLHINSSSHFVCLKRKKGRRNDNYDVTLFHQAMAGNCGFMAANLYARSIFGEDALANLSIEQNPMNPDAPVTGHIRIRAKSQVCTGI